MAYILCRGNGSCIAVATVSEAPMRMKKPKMPKMGKGMKMSKVPGMKKPAPMAGKRKKMSDMDMLKGMK